MIEVDNVEGLLLGNMTASVKIEAQKLEGVLTVPLAATRAGKEPDVTIVHVLKEGEDEFDEKAETEEREIKPGDTNYYDIVVLSGLTEGEKVKIRGFAPSIQFE
jgi:multidrug efflux pump subunit AcrA (membrane-fusion protein)